MSTSRGWRVLLPSLSDLFFVTFIVLSFMSGPAGWLRLLMDGDTGFHIRVGDWILVHGQVPYEHPFAFSVTGAPWYAFEWLSEVIFSLLHSFWGLKGVVFFAGITIAFAFLLLFRFSVWRGANPVVAMILVLLGSNAAIIHFYARPHIFTWILLIAFLWMLERDRRKNSKAVWLLVPLAALWANLHGGFVILFVLLGILIVGLGLEALLIPAERASRWQAARRYSVLGIACAAASLINPYGYRLHLHIVELLGAKWVTTILVEFKSPSFNGEPMMAFMIGLFLALGLLSHLIARRRICDALWILFLAYESLVSVRHVTMFVLVVTPILAVEISRAWESVVKAASRSSVLRILDDMSLSFRPAVSRTSVWPVVFLVCLSFLPGIPWPADFPSDLFPLDLVQRHAAALAGARVFTSDQWADYLIYRNYPRQRDFVDGQHQYYGEARVRDYLNVMQGRSSWSDVLERFQFDFVLCQRSIPLASLIRTMPGWRLMDEAGGNVLFARKQP